MRHLLLLPLLALSAPAADPPAAALVAKLGDQNYQAREEAGKDLLALGRQAIPALEAGRECDIPEVASRCETLLAAIRHKAEADATLAPKWVDLSGEPLTVQQHCDAIH